MPSAKIKIIDPKDLEQICDALESIPQFMSPYINKTLKENAELVQRDAQNNFVESAGEGYGSHRLKGIRTKFGSNLRPVNRTGWHRDAIDVWQNQKNPNSTVYHVWSAGVKRHMTNEEYQKFMALEFGHDNVAPRPFMRVALYQNKSKIRSNVQNDLRSAINQYST